MELNIFSSSIQGTDHAPEPNPIATAVRQYSASFSSQHLSEHGVASGLGVWLLLAYLAPYTTGEHRSHIEELLGAPADTAERYASTLIHSPHPAIQAALALWTKQDFLNEAYLQFEHNLDPAVARGSVPSQDGLDTWASSSTAGMIKQFPLTVTPNTALIFASALATVGNWSIPFDGASPTILAGEFGPQTTEALVAPYEHHCAIIDTPSAGRVAVHAADTVDGLLILSVLAAPDIAPNRVHAAASDIAALFCGQPSTATEVSLFDLDLGTGGAWTITEKTQITLGSNSRQEEFEAVLAPWKIASNHDLSASPEVISIAPTLYEWLRPQYRDGSLIEAKQAASAEFSKVGFKAAAVSAIGMRAMGVPPREAEATIRTATLQFNRPYAVLAVSVSPYPYRDSSATPVPQAWVGVECFAAWIGHVSA